MNPNHSLQGVVPAIITTLNADESFTAGPFEQLLGRVYAAGAHGVYVCGQTGEGLSLPVNVRKQATEAAVAHTPADRTVIVHVGAYRTADAVELARHAESAGAHAVSSLPPGSAYSFDEVKAYYRAIADAAQLPVLVYYFPEFSAAVRTLEQIDELCAIPGVAGLKFTDFDLYRLSLISRAGRVIFNGRDEVYAAGQLMGACGGIGSFYNLAPELFVEIDTLCRAGRFAEARMVQDRVNDLIRTVLAYPMLPAMKVILGWTGIAAGPCVAPRRALTGAEQIRLRSDLVNAGFAHLTHEPAE